MTFTNQKRMTVAAMGALLLAQGCATQPAGPSAADIKDLPWDQVTAEGQCNPALAALIGGALGAMIMDDDRAKGAAIGAGLGALACAIVNAQSKATKPPAQVEAEYKSDHQGRAPAAASLVEYQTAFNPAGVLRAGEEARIVSDIEVLGGADGVRELKETVEVLDPADRSRILLRAEKRIEIGARGGGVQNTFRIKLPAGMAPETYPVHTAVYVNGERAGDNWGALKIRGGGTSL